MSEREWIDGDLVVSPNTGITWVLKLRPGGDAVLCDVDSGDCIYSTVATLKKHGFRLADDRINDAQTIADLRAEIAQQAETIRQLRAQLEGRAKGSEQ